MGSYGSGRWKDHTPATTVESCLSIDAADLTRCGFWRRPAGSVALPWPRGVAWPWVDRVLLAGRGQDAHLVVEYTVRTPGGSLPLMQRVGLQTTVPNYGGLRWWFTCPLEGCERRARKLYRPPGELYFGCRQCYQLTYLSSQRNHTEDARWHKQSLDPEVRASLKATRGGRRAPAFEGSTGDRRTQWL
jgi:hypothetical protein